MLCVPDMQPCPALFTQSQQNLLVTCFAGGAWQACGSQESAAIASLIAVFEEDVCAVSRGSHSGTHK